MLQCAAVCCSVLQCVTVYMEVGTTDIYIYTLIRCSVLQRVAACCSVLQNVATFCSVHGDIFDVYI